MGTIAGEYQMPAPQDDSSVELSIVIPCLNEAETLAICVQKAMGFLEREGIRGEVIVADNGSTDGSQTIATRNGARLVPVPERGYGAALLGGINAARGKYVIMGDADDSYDLANLEAFVAKLREGADLVMGNRFKGGIEPGSMPTLHRYLGNPVLSAMGRLFFKIPVGDFHCGLRGFNTNSIRSLGLITAGMEFASEMVVRSALAGQKIEEVPTTLKPDGRSRAPHLKTWRDGWRHLKFLLMYSPKWLFLYPGTLLILAGAVLGGILLFGPLEIDSNVVLGLNTFVASCFMVICGVQIVSFGLLARHYASVTGMLPRGKRSDWIAKNITTDNVVRVAVVLFVLGLATFGFAANEWAKVGFGSLDNPIVPRTVVAGLSLVVIAIQLAFQGFMVGILQIPLARRPPQTAEERHGHAADSPELTQVAVKNGNLLG
jgi:glycosyltransferase involved in cell wall biosynthesis